MFCELAVLKMLFLEHEINLELVNIFVQNLKNGLIKLAKGARMYLDINDSHETSVDIYNLQCP